MPKKNHVSDSVEKVAEYRVKAKELINRIYIMFKHNTTVQFFFYYTRKAMLEKRCLKSNEEGRLGNITF
jgi:hypothetical protein